MEPIEDSRAESSAAPVSVPRELIPVTVLFEPLLLESIDQLTKEWGLRSRDIVINRLLMEAACGPDVSSDDLSDQGLGSIAG
jgi:hypothetical protein